MSAPSEDSPDTNAGPNTRTRARALWVDAGYAQNLLDKVAQMAGSNRRGEGPQLAATSRKGSDVYELMVTVARLDTELLSRLIAALAEAACSQDRRAAIQRIHKLVFGDDD